MKFNATILLVEDDKINQQVATAVLERMGCSVTVAENGQVALDCFEAANFDLILMDCQMSVMDGFEATRRIRALESVALLEDAASLCRIPIIALTAHAMEGDRDECLANGYDDYLSKPFTGHQLAAILVRWIGDEKSIGDPSAKPDLDDNRELTGSPSSLDEDALEKLRELDPDGTEKLLESIIHSFFSSVPSELELMHAALLQQDGPTLRMKAHSMKSSSAYLGAMRMRDLCRELEGLGQKSRFAGAISILSDLQVEYARVEPALRKLI